MLPRITIKTRQPWGFFLAAAASRPASIILVISWGVFWLAGEGTSEEGGEGRSGRGVVAETLERWQPIRPGSL